MGIASLYNIPASPEELAMWSFAHAAHHLDINRRIFELTSITVVNFVLDPVNPANMQTWIYQHQQMHQQMDFLLGIEGFDLTDVDWRDQDQLAGWIQLNSTEHLQASNILRIG